MLLCCRIVTARGYLYQHVSRKHYLLKSRRFPSALILVSFVMSLAARETCDCFYSGSNFTSFFFLLSLFLFKLFQILLLFLFHRKVSVNLIWLRARVSTVKESSILLYESMYMWLGPATDQQEANRLCNLDYFAKIPTAGGRQ